jgi:hypothetical protein
MKSFLITISMITLAITTSFPCPQAAAHGKSINAWVLDILKDQTTVHA